jgi:muramidase (phage lysozyme)
VGGLISALDEFMLQINAEKVPPLLLGKVMHMWASLPPNEWQDFDRKLERVVALVAAEQNREVVRRDH